MGILEYIIIICCVLMSISFMSAVIKYKKIDIYGDSNDKVIKAKMNKTIIFFNIFLGIIFLPLLIVIFADAAKGDYDSIRSIPIITLNLVNLYNINSRTIITSKGIGKLDVFNNVKEFFEWNAIEDYEWKEDSMLKLDIKNKKKHELKYMFNLNKEFKNEVSIILDNKVF